MDELVRARFGQLNPVQELALPAVLSGEDLLLIAPTGSGKTEAVLLPLLCKMLEENKRGLRLLYISPMRALNRNLLPRMTWWGDRLGLSVAVRHGDTPARIRKELALSPPDMLITTPETLQALLVSPSWEKSLRGVKWVIVDELHELAPTKRGAQLSVGLKRLEKLAGRYQAIGLSATVSSPEEMGRYVFSRKVRVIRPNAVREPQCTITYLGDDLSGKKRLERLTRLLEEHRCILFANSRTIVEELGHALMTVAPVAVHHGSLSRLEREHVEAMFNGGEVKSVIATSTLELGIDVGDVDYVIQYMSPRRVQDFVQRLGRSGHSLAMRSRGEILAFSVEDALESMSILSLAEEGYLEPPQLPKGPLDVAAHQLLGMAMEGEDGPKELKELFSLLLTCQPFSELGTEKLSSLVNYMERAKLVKVEDGKLNITKRGRLIYLQNLSMINDEKLYPVIDGSTGSRIGSLGMEFVYTRLYQGMKLVLGGRTWEVSRKPIQGDERVLVRNSQGQPAIPGWDGEMAFVSREVAKRVTELRVAPKLEFLSLDSRQLLVEDLERENQLILSAGMKLPSEEFVVLEACGNYLVIHVALGDAGNRGLGFYLESRLRDSLRYWWSNAYRVVLELYAEAPSFVPEVERQLLHPPDDIQDWMTAYFEDRFPFSYQMKFVAERFGMLGKGMALEGQVERLPRVFRGTPVYEEALREGLETRVSLRLLQDLLDGIRSGSVKISSKIKGDPTPLAEYSLRKVMLAELPSSESPLDLFRGFVLSSQMSLVCLNCGETVCTCKVDAYQARPCPHCGSTMLAPVFGPRRTEMLKEVVSRKAEGRLSPDDRKVISEAKRSADLLTLYGKRGAEALSVYGVGPETAFRILSRMLNEDEFFQELQAARSKYLETKPFWDDRH